MADTTLLGQIRNQHPEYNDLTDGQLADGLYKKFYSDMPRDQFNAKVGFSPTQEAADLKGVTDVVTQPDFIKSVVGSTQSQPQQPATTPESQRNEPPLITAARNRLGANYTPSPEIQRQSGLALRYGVEGLAQLPEIIGNSANAAVNVGTKALNNVAGTNIPQIPSMTQSVDQLLSSLPQPRTKIERVVAEPSKMLASIPSYAGLATASGIKALAPLAENLATQAGAAIGGGGAYGVSKEMTDNPYIQTVASLAGGLGGAGVGSLLQNSGQAATLAKIPSTADVKKAASAAYKAADDAGVIIKPEAVQNLNQGIKSDLAEFGYHPNLQPKIATVLNELDRISAPTVDDVGNAVGQNITSKQIQILRRMANAARLSNDQSEQALGKQIVSKLDSFMEGIGPNDVLQGNSAQAAEGLQKGAQLWKQYRKAQQIETAASKADLNAAASGSGGNIANTTRQAIKNILNNPKALAGFTEDEISQMNEIVRGGKMTNALRLIGKLSPSGNGLMMALNLGATAANPLMAVPGVAGIGAKAMSDRSTLRSVTQLLDLIRSGGTQEALKAVTNPVIQSVQPSVQPMLSGTEATLLQNLLRQRLLSGPSLAAPYGAASPPSGKQ